jgi:hypothetical protein
MYYAQSFVGKTVTLRTATGEEIIAELLGIDPDNHLLTVQNPRIVGLNNDQVVLMPYVLTAETLSVTVDARNVLSILETAENTAVEYQNMISEETQA